VLNSVLQNENNIEINVGVKPYTLAQLCHLYQVCDKTMRKWLDHCREELGGRLDKTRACPEERRGTRESDRVCLDFLLLLSRIPTSEAELGTSRQIDEGDSAKQ
jgi:hypothetical protein